MLEFKGSVGNVGIYMFYFWCLALTYADILQSVPVPISFYVLLSLKVSDSSIYINKVLMCGVMYMQYEIISLVND